MMWGPPDPSPHVSSGNPYLEHPDAAAPAGRCMSFTLRVQLLGVGGSNSPASDLHPKTFLL